MKEPGCDRPKVECKECGGSGACQFCYGDGKVNAKKEQGDG